MTGEAVAEGRSVQTLGVPETLDGGVFEIGYWVHSPHAGLGFATAAAVALSEAGLAQPGIDRIEIYHDVDNPASGRVAAKAGFRVVGPVEAEKKAPSDSGTHLVWTLRRHT